MPREQAKSIQVNWGYLLDNGNIVIPQIISREPLFVGWVEVEPGTSEHKRFLPKARREPDIRQTEPYRSYVLTNFPQFAWTLEGVYRVPWKVKGDEHVHRTMIDGQEQIETTKASR